jgi:hypothetical protein
MSVHMVCVCVALETDGKRLFMYAAGIWDVLFANSMLGWIIGICLCLASELPLYIQLYLQLLVMLHTQNGDQLLCESIDCGGIWVLSLYHPAVGFLADLFAASLAINFVAWIALVSGFFVFAFMRETRAR